MKEKIRITIRTEIGDVNNDNVDVQVKLKDGREYVATFFTYSNLNTLIEKNKKTGEYMNGIYFWTSDMILIENLEISYIQKTIEDMISDKTFFDAFSKI